MNPDQSSRPIRLKALGHVDLWDSAGRSAQQVLQRPKQVAVFTVLAVGDSAVQSRDQLMAMFWPNSSRERASHSLNQSLYQLRRELGDVVQRQGDRLLVPQDEVWCDVSAFEAAVRDGDHERASELYRGDFLEGLYLSGTPTFERWVDTTRDRLRRSAAASTWHLAEAASEEGLLTDASALARRASELTPGEEAPLRRLLLFLDTIGDRGGALAAFEDFREVLHREFEVDPSPETLALVRDIKAREEALGSPSGPRPQVQWAATGPSERRAATAADSGKRHGHSRALTGAAAGLALVAAGWLLTAQLVDRSIPPLESGIRMAVLGGEVGVSPGTPGFGTTNASLAARSARALEAALANSDQIEVIAAPGVSAADLSAVARRYSVNAVALVEAWDSEAGTRQGVQLVDPVSGGVVAMETFADTAAPWQLERFVRTRAGIWQDRRRIALEAPTARALALIREADRLEADGQRYFEARNSELAEGFLAQADSVLGVASAEFPTWSTPLLLRSWMALDRAAARAMSDVSDIESIRAHYLLGERYAEQLLDSDPTSPLGLEVRGANRFSRFRILERENTELGQRAEEDLEAAVAGAAGMSGAWTRLARLRRGRGDFFGALAALLSALEVDDYWRYEEPTLTLLLDVATYEQDEIRAEAACEEGRARFADALSFAECRLSLMAWFDGRASGEAIETELEQLRALGSRASTRAPLHLVYAAGAYALLDSTRLADSLLAVSRTSAPGASQVGTDLEEARVRALLGQYEDATEIVRSVLESAPGLGPSLRTEPRLDSLRGYPPFISWLDSVDVAASGLLDPR